MRVIQVGLIGCGTVGTGVARMLLAKADLIARRLGVGLNLKSVADIDPEQARKVPLADGVYCADAHQVVADPQIDIIIEMIGGDGVARDLILKAISNGKHVVTANKALLAAQGTEIFQAAARQGVDLYFEASVGGCMPIIKTLRESMVANQVTAMTGILNGTCNYILTRIGASGSPFETALKEAQNQGYAEADPTLDVEGLDTAHKLAILASLAYGMELNLADIYIEGISRITPFDIRMAAQFGYRIKLLAISKYRDKRVEARVHPTMIPVDNLLSNVQGRVNAVMVTAEEVDDIMLYGYGAGMMPTASAVLADTVDLARNIIHGTNGRVPMLSYQMAEIRAIPVVRMEELVTHYYFRFAALDQPGVLSKISGVLGDHGISLQSVHQKGRKTNGSVPVVMLSHQAKEADVQQALSEIAQLDIVSDHPMLIRIEDQLEMD